MDQNDEFKDQKLMLKLLRQLKPIVNDMDENNVSQLLIDK